MGEYQALVEAWARAGDVSPLFADHEVFTVAMDALRAALAGTAVDAVAGIEGLGLILGTALALDRGVGVIALRWGGQLRVAVERVDFTDGTGRARALEVRRGLVRQGWRVLVVDDWLRGEERVRAGVELIERTGGHVAGIAALGVDGTAERGALLGRYPVFGAWYAV